MRHVSGQFLEMELCFENEACLRAVLEFRRKKSDFVGNILIICGTFCFLILACLRAVLVLRIIFSK